MLICFVGNILVDNCNFSPGQFFDDAVTVQVVYIQGGLGNQLFQYAFACYLRQRTTEQVWLYWSKNDQRRLWLNLFPITFPFLSDTQRRPYEKNALTEEKKWYRRFLLFLKTKGIKIVTEDTSLLLEQQVRFNRFNWKNTFYEGFWQSAQIANSVCDVLLKELQPFPTPCAESLKIADRIRSCKMATAIHLRTAWRYNLDINDSKRKIQLIHCQTSLSRNYYVNAINYIKDFCRSGTFFVFADDPAAAKSILSDMDLPDDTFYLSHYQRPDWEDMFLMQLCQNFILSNSSFSWWGHWFSYALRPRQKPLVIMPEYWDGFGINKSESLQLKIHEKVLLISNE